MLSEPLPVSLTHLITDQLTQLVEYSIGQSFCMRIKHQASSVPLLINVCLLYAVVVSHCCDTCCDRDGVGVAEHEESVEEYVRRNLGAEVFERLIEPFCSGVYAGDADKLSMKAAFGKVEWLTSLRHPFVFFTSLYLDWFHAGPLLAWSAARQMQMQKHSWISRKAGTSCLRLVLLLLDA